MTTVPNLSRSPKVAIAYYERQYLRSVSAESFTILVKEHYPYSSEAEVSYTLAYYAEGDEVRKKIESNRI